MIRRKLAPLLGTEESADLPVFFFFLFFLNALSTSKSGSRKNAPKHSASLRRGGLRKYQLQQEAVRMELSVCK